MNKSRKRFNTPILFITYHRPKETKIVLEKIKAIKPLKLYLFSDGSKSNDEYDNNLVIQTRELFQSINWDCEVKMKYKTSNAGIKRGVVSAIDWFFETEDSGIILEDDVVPSNDFFYFMAEMLSKYRDHEKVWIISGHNDIHEQRMSRLDESYYFSQFLHIWGWATWKRVWEKYDINMTFWPEYRESDHWVKGIRHRPIRRYLKSMFDLAHSGHINSWDHQLHAKMLHTGSSAVIPKINLIQNIGYGPGATNNSSWNSATNECEIAIFNENKIFPLTYPARVENNLRLDKYEFYKLRDGLKFHFLTLVSGAIIGRVHKILRVFTGSKYTYQ